MGKSLWIATTPETSHPALTGDLDADVAVVGGGIVGVVTAVLLRRAGRSVVLLERDRIGCGVTGNTTAKLTSQHGLRYADLAKRAGDRVARLYGQANQAAIAWAAEQDIDFDLRRAPAYVWAADDTELHRVRAEAEAASRLGLPATFEPGPAAGGRARRGSLRRPGADPSAQAPARAGASGRDLRAHARHRARRGRPDPAPNGVRNGDRERRGARDAPALCRPRSLLRPAFPTAATRWR